MRQRWRLRRLALVSFCPFSHHAAAAECHQCCVEERRQRLMRQISGLFRFLFLTDTVTSGEWECKVFVVKPFEGTGWLDFRCFVAKIPAV